MDDALVVGGTQGAAHPPQDLDDPVRGGQRGPQDLGQTLALDMLHRDEEDLVLLVEIVQPTHPGMADSSRQDQFAFEALPQRDIAREPGLQAFDGDAFVEQDVDGFEDDAMAPAPELGLELEAAQSIANLQHRWMVSCRGGTCQLLQTETPARPGRGPADECADRSTT